MNPFRLSALAAALVSSCLITWLVRRFAPRFGIIDVPNSRSSHTVPTPRGGGIGIVFAVLAVVGIARFFPGISAEWSAALFVGGGLVAAAGVLDDFLDLPPLTRTALHILAAGWVLWRINVLDVLHHTVLARWAWPATVLCLVLILWNTNLFNFMDGIDGLAGSQLVFVALAQGALLWMDGIRDISFLYWVMAAAGMGFLMWNWPPAKIFMGNTGSEFVGFAFGVMIIFSGTYGLRYLLASLILSLVFSTDATLTLLRRMSLGNQWYKAHRAHAYQHAAQRFGSHRAVTLAVLVGNIFWLFPLAWLVVVRESCSSAALLAAAIPVVAVVAYFRPGEDQYPGNN